MAKKAPLKAVKTPTAKKEESISQIADLLSKDFSELMQFMYPQGTKIEVDANFLHTVLSLANKVVESETSFVFDSDGNSKSMGYTQLGIDASLIHSYLLEMHVRNIDQGLAKTKDTLDTEASTNPTVSSVTRE